MQCRLTLLGLMALICGQLYAADGSDLRGFISETQVKLDQIAPFEIPDGIYTVRNQPALLVAPRDIRYLIAPGMNCFLEAHKVIRDHDKPEERFEARRVLADGKRLLLVGNFSVPKGAILTFSDDGQILSVTNESGLVCGLK